MVFKGVGKDTHCLSDYLVQMRVFDSNGELRTYSLEKDKDVFKAVSAAFGCFGIVYDVTFKVGLYSISNNELRLFFTIYF